MNEQNPSMICDIATGVCGTADEGGRESSEGGFELIDMNSSVKKVKILYYTDPICSACWALEPLLRKFSEQYGQYFTLSHRMGGLLDNWDRYGAAGGGIRSPKDVAPHWEEMSRYSRMPMSGDVWLEDPLTSSYPPSIAFKAAQRQGEAAAEQFLRKIREIVFLENKNIAKEEVLVSAAEQCGLDEEQLIKDIRDKTTANQFYEEMEEGRRLGVRAFPTLIFTDDKGNGLPIVGIRPYETYVKALEQISNQKVAAQPIAMNVEQALDKYKFLATEEIRVLLDLTEQQALEQLQQLDLQHKIQKVPVKNGVFWRAK